MLRTTMQLPDGYIDSHGALERTFELPSFRDAIAFVGRVADLAEEANHHPDIAISYKKVTLRWTTHSAGGLTDLDYELASRTDALVEP
jgi:4a-hydroxytetrahydrobiopterin dehydratase